MTASSLRPPARSTTDSPTASQGSPTLWSPTHDLAGRSAAVEDTTTVTGSPFPTTTVRGYVNAKLQDGGCSDSGAVAAGHEEPTGACTSTWEAAIPNRCPSGVDDRCDTCRQAGPNASAESG